MEIALIAHDAKKAEMVQFLNEHRDRLEKKGITLDSTGTTGKKVKKADFVVTRLLSGPMVGDAQVAARVVEGKCNMILFSRDPLEKTSARTRCFDAYEMSILYLYPKIQPQHNY